jgi:hypothetical protein
VALQGVGRDLDAYQDQFGSFLARCKTQEVLWYNQTFCEKQETAQQTWPSRDEGPKRKADSQRCKVASKKPKLVEDLLTIASDEDLTIDSDDEYEDDPSARQWLLPSTSFQPGMFETHMLYTTLYVSIIFLTP